MPAVPMDGDFEMPGRPVPGVFARFYSKPTKDEAASKAEGRIVMKEEVFINIRTPGNMRRIIDRPMRKGEEFKFPREWAAFQAKREMVVEGTPLSLWPVLSEAQVEELKHFGVQTLEQLAEVPDGQIQNIGLYQTLKQKAKAAVAAMKDAAPLEKMRAELEDRDAKIEALQFQVSRLMEADSDAPKRGPGRPKKVPLHIPDDD